MNDIRMVEAETRYRNAKDVARLFAVAAVCALSFVGLLVNLMVGRG